MANGMRILAAPRPGTDTPFISGESGAIGARLLYELMSNEQYRELKERLVLNIHAHVLLISTEGDTSPDIYEDIVWFFGLCGTGIGTDVFFLSLMQESACSGHY